MSWLASLLDDARFAWRALWRDRGVMAVVSFTLALGVGVNAAAFAVLDRLYLRVPAGVDHPGTLHRVWIRHHRTGDGVPFASPAISFPQFAAMAAASPDSTRLALFHTDHALREGPTTRAPRLSGSWATASIWRVLGVRAARGRLFGPDEDRASSPALVAVVSDDFWRTRLGADPAAIGRALDVGRQRYTIVGVLPRGFRGVAQDFRPVDVWMPLAAMPSPPWMNGPWREARYFNGSQALHRATAEEAAAFAQRATAAVRADDIAHADGMVPDSLEEVLTGPMAGIRGPGTAGQEVRIAQRLGAVAVVVLLIAAANVVNVLLARAARRRREVAVRLALGVTRSRLARLLGVEALLLALVAGALALLAARWSGEALRTMLLGDFAWREPAVDLRVAGFTVVLTLATALTCALVPALRASTPAAHEALRQGTREGGPRHARLRAGLVAIQAALSVLLLAGAALFVRSLQNVRGLDIGFDRERLLFGAMEFDDGRGPAEAAVEAAVARAAERVRAHPAVEATARTTMQPMNGWSMMTLWIGDDSVTRDMPTMSGVSAGFFRAAGLALVEGREPGEGAREVVVNRAMADAFWPGVRAIGRCVRVRTFADGCYTVVGIAETARRDNVIEPAPAPQYYLPLGVPALHGWAARTLVVRARAGAGSAAAATAAARTALQESLPAGSPGMATVTSMSEALEPQYRPWRDGARLFSALGLLALAVAMVGMYGTVSYGVSRRTQEFGVRSALGARVRDLVALVLREAAGTALAGIALGVLLALAAARLVASLVYGVSPRDPVVLAGAALALLGVALLAALVPALRGARVDPAVVLRSGE